MIKINSVVFDLGNVLIDWDPRYLYRKGRKTLPAVLRYSKVPTSVLVEIANLNNKHDRRSLLESKTRQQIALAITNSVVANFGRTSGLVAKL